MNKNALKQSSRRKIVTVIGKLPDSFGHSKVEGVTRKLTKAELKQQARNLKTGNLL